MHKGPGLEWDLDSEKSGEAAAEAQVRKLEQGRKWWKRSKGEKWKPSRCIYQAEQSGRGLDAMMGERPVFRAASEFHLMALAILPQFLGCLLKLMLDS